MKNYGFILKERGTKRKLIHKILLEERENKQGKHEPHMVRCNDTRNNINESNQEDTSLEKMTSC